MREKKRIGDDIKKKIKRELHWNELWKKPVSLWFVICVSVIREFGIVACEFFLWKWTIAYDSEDAKNGEMCLKDETIHFIYIDNKNIYIMFMQLQHKNIYTYIYI